MRVLLRQTGLSQGDIDDDELTGLYAMPAQTRVVRANFVTTLDGAATGPDGRSGTINDAADRKVFALLRQLADAVVIGAGTARIEGYRPVEPTHGHAPPLIVVSNSAHLPDRLRNRAPDAAPVVLATRAAAGKAALGEARSSLGEDSVWVLGEQTVDLVALVDRLEAEGMPHVLTEGGPSLHRDLLAEDLIDELALTLVPRAIGAEHTRITHGGPVDVRFRPAHLLEQDGTLIGLWRRTEPSSA